MEKQEAIQVAQDIQAADAFLRPISVTNDHSVCELCTTHCPCPDGYVVVVYDVLRTDFYYFLHSRKAATNLIRNFT